MSEKVVRILSTGCGLGYMPVAPGTAGSLLGIPLFLLMTLYPWYLYLITIIAFTALAVHIAEAGERIFKKRDDSRIVIDEIAGFLWAMLFVKPDVVRITISFLLFRAFDIIKPYPIRKIEKILPGGWGIVMDDVIAGIFTCISLHGLTYITKLRMY